MAPVRPVRRYAGLAKRNVKAAIPFSIAILVSTVPIAALMELEVSKEKAKPTIA